jgi:hypothetical protein
MGIKSLTTTGTACQKHGLDLDIKGSWPAWVSDKSDKWMCALPKTIVFVALQHGPQAIRSGREGAMTPSIDIQDDFMRWFYGGTPPVEDQKYIHRVIIMGVHSDATHQALGADGASQACCRACLHRLTDASDGARAGPGLGRL